MFGGPPRLPLTYSLCATPALFRSEGGVDVMHACVTPSGGYRVAALNNDAATELTIQDREGKALTLAGIPDGDIGGVRFNRDETMVAFTVAADTSPADIFVADLAAGKARRLTTALNPDI